MCWRRRSGAGWRGRSSTIVRRAPPRACAARCGMRCSGPSLMPWRSPALLWLARRISRRLDRHVEARIGGWEERARNVVQLRACGDSVRRILRGALVVFGLVLLYTYLNALLLALPWTRDAGREALANGRRAAAAARARYPARSART